MDPVTTGLAGGAVLGGLAAVSIPAEALVQRVSDALGVLYEPTRIRRAARAEVEADKIRAVGRLEVSEVEERGLIRMVREQGRIQENIESITNIAAGALADSAKPEGLDSDWLMNFFDKCKLVSDREMQQLGAKILAEQANTRAFSKRTVALVSTLEKADAELFTMLCGFVWIADGVPAMLIEDSNSDFYRERGAGFGVLKRCESLGLLSVEQMGHSRRCSYPVMLSYIEGDLTIDTGGVGDTLLGLGQVLLTQPGMELFRICKAAPIDGLAEHVVGVYEKAGFSVKWSSNA